MLFTLLPARLKFHWWQNISGADAFCGGQEPIAKPWLTLTCGDPVQSVVRISGVEISGSSMSLCSFLPHSSGEMNLFSFEV
jgi:hypothetical protein